MADNIQFFSEDITFVLHEKLKHRKWLKEIARNYTFSINGLTYVFCSDAYLLPMNQQYLDHDTLTDVITFDNRDGDGDRMEKKVYGDIFISVDRVKDNALGLGVDFKEELRRVMVHGLLHLLGFKDKTRADKEKMTGAENEALQAWLTA